VPESDWLGRETPGRPEVNARPAEGGVEVEMKMRRGKQPWQWLVRVLTARGWKSAIVPGSLSQQHVALPNDADARTVMVSGISRLGREGQSARAKISDRN
jgi:hypothetical protein